MNLTFVNDDNYVLINRTEPYKLPNISFYVVMPLTFTLHMNKIKLLNMLKMAFHQLQIVVVQYAI
jgi:hypothetical protein